MEEFASSPYARCALAGLLILLVIPGCGRPERSQEPKAGSASQGKATPSKVAEARAAEAPPPEVKPAPLPPASPAAEAPVPAAPAPAPTAETPPARPAAETVKSPSPAGAAPKKEAKAATPAKPAAPPLDLAALEQRIKETEAIGFMTKLTLKNQVDELLGRFEAHHEGTEKANLAELRQPFDLLILKVLSLLQDRDAALASAISTSREAMWSILSDPAKFRSFLTQNRS